MTRVLISGEIFKMNPGGGICRMFAELLPRLAEKGFECTINLPTVLPAPFADHKGLRYWRHPAAGWKKKLREFSERRRSPGIFHASYYERAPWKGMRSVVSVYDFIDARCSLWAPNYAGFVARQAAAIESADAVVTISHATKTDVLKFTDAAEAKIHVVPLAASDCFSIMANTEDRELPRPIDRPYWLYVGSRDTYKNFPILIDAFLRLSESRDEDLVIMGGGNRIHPHLIEQLVRRRLETRVHLFPRVSDALLRSAYQNASAFVFPSFWEGFGIPVLEALSCGTPTVLSDIPVFHEIAGDSAKYFDPHSAEHLVESLVTAVDQAKELRSLGFQAAQKYSWGASADAMARIYHSLT